VLRPEARLDLLAFLDHLGELGVVHAVLALVVLGELVEIGELPRAGGVIHDRHQFDHVAVDAALEGVGHVLGGDLAAQVQQVVGAQVAGVARFGDAGDGRLADVAAVFLAVVAAAGHRVEHGGDACADDVRIMREDAGHGRPAHAGARHEVAFDVVGVHFDEARYEVVALHVLRRGRAAAPGADSGDVAVAQDDVAVEDFVVEDDVGVVEDDFAVHCHAAILACWTS
jgi:hypothetical protein